MAGIDRRTFIRTTSVTAGAATLSVSTAAATHAAGRGAGHRVQTGIEVLHDDDYRLVQGERVGLISNPTGIVPDLRHEIDLIVESGHVDLVAAFGPEHGFRGSAQAGGSEGDYADPRTGVPVYDTYGKGPAQIAAFFDQAGVDSVLFDIQDVGARFYTYIWTMYDCMVAAATAGVRFIVLDRPNPIGGRAAYGPVMHPEHASFVGRKAISQQHGMTVGELAGLFNAEFVEADAGAQAELDVVEMRGWRRGMFHEETGHTFVMPSPNMPRVETAVAYPGTCLFEATNLSEGRGTTRPFELIGAPYLDHTWGDALREQQLPGVEFREAYFTPTSSKHQGTSCAGVQLHVTDRGDFDAIRTAIAMIITAKQIAPEFAWRESQAPFWMDRLTGSEQVRLDIDAGAGVDEVVAGWQEDLQAFRRVREAHLRYRGRAR
ncbi:exo-beta-N-acetylmuramidase NamZ family protein [Nocardioides sp.]|uniref:exo-beta-N-acetylmuramidase NamZ family protein n=1 Tax=Nocardioides sp. TaxID=35761 RepID=UPI002ED168FA